MKLMRILTFSLFAFGLANCSLEIGVEDLTDLPNDFLKSSIISETTAVADGVAELIVTIELRNSDDSLVTSYAPSFEIITGASVTIVGCTASNQLGISTCRLKSSIVGIKTISFTNIDITLTEDVEFTPPNRDGTFLQIVSAAQNNVNASGYSVTTQLGAWTQGLNPTNNGGFETFVGTTGAITPTQ